MNNYFAYYLAWIFAAYLLRTPWLLFGIIALLFMRRFIPVPSALLGFGRARRLRNQVEVNRANVTARRDLATLYIDGLRARSAVRLLEEGLALLPNDAELLYLHGLALHRAGRHEQALSPLVRAVELDPRVRSGLPYAVAGDALSALGRWDGAVDAYEHYLADNGSDVSGYTRLARAHARSGDRAAAKEALHEGIRTWGILPSAMKRRQFGRYLRAHWARVSVLREPAAMVTALVLAGLFAVTVRYSYAPVLTLFRPSAPWYTSGDLDPYRRALYNGFARCGSQRTGDFAGKYEVLMESVTLPELGADASAIERDAVEKLNDHLRDQYANFEIKSDRIVSGTVLIQEYCLSRVLDRSKTSLKAEAVWHTDVADPGDASMVMLELRRDGDSVTLRIRQMDLPEQDASVFKIKLKRL